ncbi:hypothetical protein KMZ29_14705 [Bradyrhizobium sediminis]|uniref:NrS-1 polymerase-like helicase domain-containing protein n=1 Tax=Bradyrhizobium sediminis TaxID=2840469 RepID=A0A975NAN8_9BRAD|nr:primase-helicase family protein [Bradyrhizobium sediminis]QWG11031.1 hypothetical protein KMZ29_14705 [Bradyrhizobium sediminis]
MNTALCFTERLCQAYDFNRGCPPADGAERATRDEIVEYIDAFSIDKSPDHPTSAIAWDLQRTLGESEGRRMLLYASRRWDATPLRARDVVKMWWDDDHEPEAWRDEYLIDVIGSWRSERDRLRLCADAEKVWLAFKGAATSEQLANWRTKYGAWYLAPERKLGPVTIIKPGNVVPFPAKAADVHAVKHEDFWAYSPAHSYIFVPTGEHWPASTVNSRLAPVIVPMREKPIPAATFLDQNRSVEQATWAPGQSQIIADRLIADGGWIDRAGCKTFNLYRPPTIKPKAGDASPWIDHIRWVYPEEAEHIISWLAQRVQRPDIKINHALVLGGNQGIGKDTLLEPVKAAVGPWNCSEVSPQQVLGRFNSFVKSVILRISEARDLGDTDRFAFYEHLKTLTAAPPDVLRVDEKHLREHAVLNVCGVIQTTNNKDALHLPADDRRHFVAWSPRSKDDFQPGYWSALYSWFATGGNEIVAHHLATLDLSAFDAKAPPPKTRAFWEIVDASRAPEDAEMADAIDALGKPAAVTTQQVLGRSSMGFADWLRDRKNRRKIGHRFEGCGYVSVRNPDDARDGQWKIAGRRQTVYAKRELCLRDQVAAAERLTMLPSPS